MINGLETAREFHDKLIEFDESRLDSQSNREWQNINSDINPFYYNGKKYDELIFCHIPKTGGTSINAAFGWTYFCDPPPHIANETEGTLRPHLNIGTEHRITDKHLYPDCFVFTFTRNPYDRFISHYNYIKKHGAMFGDMFWSPDGLDEHKKNLIGETKNISEFLRQKDLGEKMMQLDPVAVVPQHVWLPNGADFIGKLENLDNDFKTLTRILKKDLDLPHLNVSIKEATELDKEEKQIIYEFYKKDFEIFGYDKDF